MSSLTKSDLILGFLKVLLVTSLFFYIRTLNISDNYKFILTIVPSIFILVFNKLVTDYKHKGGNKAIYVKRNDDESDINLYDEFFFEDYEDYNLNDKLIQNNNRAKIYEIEKPFWISKGYFDISNPNNFIYLNNLDLTSNYTIELWLKLKYIANNNILSFYDRTNKLLFEIKYDTSFIYLGKFTKIPILNQWFQLVIMRGKYNTIGSNRGYMYINGIFNGYIEDLPDLSEVSDGYLFKYSNSISELLEYNKNYNDLCNCSIVRIYNRSLTLDELQNNYLKEASYYELEEVGNYERTCVHDESLVFYLDSRVNTNENEYNEPNYKPRLNWLEMAKETPLKVNKISPTKKKLVKPKQTVKKSKKSQETPKESQEKSKKIIKDNNDAKNTLKTTKPIL
jgi:hypothetical protein